MRRGRLWRVSLPRSWACCQAAARYLDMPSHRQRSSQDDASWPQPLSLLSPPASGRSPHSTTAWRKCSSMQISRRTRALRRRSLAYATASSPRATTRRTALARAVAPPPSRGSSRGDLYLQLDRARRPSRRGRARRRRLDELCAVAATAAHAEDRDPHAAHAAAEREAKRRRLKVAQLEGGRRQRWRRRVRRARRD